jgi:hypothetical protein
MLALLLTVLLTVTGCSSKLTDVAPATVEPARAAVSPPPATAPVGQVLPLGGQPAAAIFDRATAALAVLSPGADPQAAARVTIVGPTASGRTVTLPGPATAIAGDDRGTVYLSTRGGFVTVDLASGTTTPTAITGETATDFTADRPPHRRSPRTRQRRRGRLHARARPQRHAQGGDLRPGRRHRHRG